MTFQKGLGAGPGLSQALGSLKEPALHHGTLNAVLLPPVLRFNAGHVGDKYERLAASMGLARDADLAAETEGLNARIGLPRSLRAMGVPESVIRGPGEGLGVDSCAVAKRVGWCAMRRGGRLWRGLLVLCASRIWKRRSGQPRIRPRRGAFR